MQLTSALQKSLSIVRDSNGVAAVEFAIILPFFLLLYLGGFDAINMVRVYDKTQIAAKTVADLVGQEPTSQPIAQSELASLLNAAAAVATPFNTTSLAITISAVDLALQGSGSSQTCCTATLRWSATMGGTLRPCQTTLRQITSSAPWAIDTFPASLGTQQIITSNNQSIYNGSVIVTDISYANTAITPLISVFANRTIMQHTYAIPRTVGQVTVTPTGNTSVTAMTNLSSNQSGQICP